MIVVYRCIKCIKAECSDRSLQRLRSCMALYDPRKQDLKKIFSGAMPQAIMPLITVCCAQALVVL